MDLPNLPDPVPCPCCGNKDLYVGCISGDSFGVKCLRGTEDFVILCLVRSKKIPAKELALPEFQGCGLRMSVPMPDDYPEDFPDDLIGMDSLHYLQRLTLIEGILRWNRRI